MEWLITIRNRDVDAFVNKQSAWGFQLNEDHEPIPLGEDRQVIAISGPADLQSKIANESLDIQIYPNSNLEPG